MIKNFKQRRLLQNDSPEGDRLQNGTNQVTFSGGRFETHEGSTGFGIIQRSLGLNKVYTQMFQMSISEKQT